MAPPRLRRTIVVCECMCARRGGRSCPIEPQGTLVLVSVYCGKANKSKGFLGGYDWELNTFNWCDRAPAFRRRAHRASRLASRFMDDESDDAFVCGLPTLRVSVSQPTPPPLSSRARARNVPPACSSTYAPGTRR